MNFLPEQDVIRSSDEFENGCIPMHCMRCAGGDLMSLAFKYSTSQRSDSVPIARWVVFSRPSVCLWVGGCQHDNCGTV